MTATLKGMESESPLEVLSRAATMLHREETAAESPYANSEYTRASAPSLAPQKRVRGRVLTPLGTRFSVTSGLGHRKNLTDRVLCRPALVSPQDPDQRRVCLIFDEYHF